jgi:manganese transport protein
MSVRAAPARAVAELESERTIGDAYEALDGRRRGFRALLPFLGPAFIASIAYVDPGNFATNIAGGAQFGYALLWVVLFANISAMLVQSLAAKVGVATGKNIAELCRDNYGAPLSYALWTVSEIGAMATDVAEFVGAALGFLLLFHVPLFGGACLAAVAVIAILVLQQRGFRRFEAVIASFVGVILCAYIFEVALARPLGLEILRGSFVPTLPHGSAYLAVGLLGATVMPHVVFLHSSLTQARVVPRSPQEARAIYRFQVADVLIALGLAGVINMAMMAVAAALYHVPGAPAVSRIEDAYRTLTPLLGPAAAAAFGVALLASGLSSSTVGTMAGQVIMQGFVRFSIPVWVRRAVTMIPSFAVIGMGLDPQTVIVFTQVVLSFVLPFALVPLVLLTARSDVMGGMVNSRFTTALASIVTLAIIAFNAMLLVQTLH